MILRITIATVHAILLPADWLTSVVGYSVIVTSFAKTRHLRTPSMAKNNFIMASSRMDSGFIRQYTNYQYTTPNRWWVCFCWGLFLRTVRCLRLLGCHWMPLASWLVQAATLLELTTRLVDDIGHGFSYILLLLFCDSLSAVESPCGPFHLENCEAQL